MIGEAIVIELVKWSWKRLTPFGRFLTLEGVVSLFAMSPLIAIISLEPGNYAYISMFTALLMPCMALALLGCSPR